MGIFQGLGENQRCFGRLDTHETHTRVFCPPPPPPVVTFAPQRPAHCFTTGGLGAARGWFPCADVHYQRPQWAISITVRADLVAVGSGKLEEQVRLSVCVPLSMIVRVCLCLCVCVCVFVSLMSHDLCLCSF
jgi:hypothetical protein